MNHEYAYVEFYDERTKSTYLKKTPIKPNSDLESVSYNYISKQESEILPDDEVLDGNTSDVSGI